MLHCTDDSWLASPNEITTGLPPASIFFMVPVTAIILLSYCFTAAAESFSYAASSTGTVTVALGFVSTSAVLVRLYSV